jgi:PAS domain S-box-containing protein
MVAMLRDVTDRVQRERDLQRSFEELEGLLNTLNDMVFLHDADGSIRYVNQSAAVRLGYSESELLEMTPRGIVSRRDAARYDKLIDEAQHEGSVTFEATAVASDGERIPVEVSVARTQYRGDTAFLSVARDVSDRRERERMLRRFEKAIEQTAHAVYITDTDGTIEYVNPQFTEQTGYTAAEAIGETPHILNSGTHDDEFFAEMWETILAGDTWQSVVVNERADGTEYYVDQTVAPIQDADGEIEAFVAVNVDITERRELQQELTEQRDDLDVLNQVLRHDIRNDLQLVLAYGDLVAERLDDGELREYVETITESAEHAVELTETARDMSAVMLDSDDDFERMDLRSVVQSELENCEGSYSEAEFTVDGSIPDVDVTANDMLQSVFRNLISNAVQHNDAETPRVEVDATERGDTVAVSVVDNGPGVPESQREDIFGKGNKGLDSTGTGLGLFLVRTLVESFGGSVRVEDSESAAASTIEDVGAVFVVELPVASR